MQNSDCGMRVYVLGDSNFKYTITWLLRHLFPPFLKMAVVNTNVPIYLKYSVTQSNFIDVVGQPDGQLISNTSLVTFNNITICAICKDGVCQSPLCPYLRNTGFRSIYHHILSASCCRKVQLMYSGDLFDPLLTLLFNAKYDMFPIIVQYT